MYKQVLQYLKHRTHASVTCPVSCRGDIWTWTHFSFRYKRRAALWFLDLLARKRRLSSLKSPSHHTELLMNFKWLSMERHTAGSPQKTHSCTQREQLHPAVSSEQPFRLQNPWLHTQVTEHSLMGTAASRLAVTVCSGRGDESCSALLCAYTAW